MSDLLRSDEGLSYSSLGLAVFLSELRVSTSKLFADLTDLVKLGEWASRVGFSSIWLGPIALMASHGEIAPYTPESRCFIDPAFLPSLSSCEVAPRGDGRVGDSLGVMGNLALRRSCVAASHLEADLDQFESSEYFNQIAAERILRYLDKDQLDLAAKVYVRIAYGESYCSKHSPAELRQRVVLSQMMGHQALNIADSIIPIALDLPIGTRPGGVDAVAFAPWALQEGSLGAPPDYFNPQGQSWGLVGYDLGSKSVGDDVEPLPLTTPIRLFAPVTSGLRIDHAIGLQRLCIVRERSEESDRPGPMSFVDQPRDRILAVLKAISQETGLVMVAEDLGVVPDGLRDALVSGGMRLTKVLCFEVGDAEGFVPDSIVSFTTHDTHTARQLLGDCATGTAPDGLRSTALRHLLRSGRPEVRLSEQFLDFVGKNFHADENGSRRGFIEAILPRIFATLEQSTSSIKLISLRDLCGECERVNIPGTAVAERLNFFVPLGKPGEFLSELCGVNQLFEYCGAPGS